MYRSLSQSNTDFDDFLNSFDSLLNIVDKSSSLLTVILGDFNGRSSSWWVDDKTTTVCARPKHLQLLMDFNNWYHCPPIYCLIPLLALISYSLMNPTWWSVVEFTQTVTIRLFTASLISVLNILHNVKN